MISFTRPDTILDKFESNAIDSSYENVKNDTKSSKFSINEEGVSTFIRTKLWKNFSYFLLRSLYFVQYNLKEIVKRKCQYGLGLGAVVLVVIAVTATISATGQLPIVFLRIAELDRGQYDIIIQSSGRYSTSLNYSMFEANLRKGSSSEELYQSRYSLHTPRLVGQNLLIYSGKTCQYDGKQLPIIKEDFNITEGDDPKYTANETNWVYGAEVVPDCMLVEEGIWNCLEKYCDRRFSATLVSGDTEKEKKIGFGRNWKMDRLGVGECYVSYNLAYALDLEIGDTILVPFWGENFLTGPFREVGIITNETEVGEILFSVTFPLTIAGIFSDFEGKFDYEAYGSEVIYVEYDSILEHVSTYLHPVYDEYKADLTGINLFDYSSNIFVNVPNRIQEYNSADFIVVRNRIGGFAGEITYLAGFDQIEARYPILDYLETLDMIALFLNLIINIIIIILVGLSVVLIYSLLLINVEDRTFEMGILRMIGLQLSGLMQMIFQQALMYSVPGIVVGLVFGEFVYLIIGIVLGRIFEVTLPFFISWQSVLVAVPLGFAIPIVGAIVPIRNALKKNLHECLDTRRSKVKAVKVSIERSSTGKISIPLLIFAVSAFVFGFFIYYFLPLAMISMKLSLLLTIFFAIIVLMNIGCVILALNLETILHKVLTFLLLFFENVAVKSLVMKNLVSHKERNRKTTIMYGVSLAFLIFIAVATKLEIRQYTYIELRNYGTPLRLYQSNWWWRSLNDYEFQERFQNLVDKSDVLVDYCYKTYPLSRLVSFNGIDTRTIGGYNWERMDLSGVSPNFYEIMDPTFTKVTKRINDGLSLSESLYTQRGSYSTMISTNVYEELFLGGDLDRNFVIQMWKETEMFPKYYYYLMRAQSIMEGGAGSSFSKYNSDFMGGGKSSGINENDVFISLPSLLRFLEPTFTRVEDIPIKFIYIKLKGGYTKKEKEELKSQIKETFTGLHALYLHDVEDEYSTINLIDDSMNVFFLLSTVIAMVLCFFSLISNMYTNIQQQSKEIGIIRSMGMRKFKVYRVYIYEALIIIYAAAFIGIATGTFIGYTLILQQQLFTQLPLGFVFPWEITLIVIGSGIVFAILASFYPIWNLLKGQVTDTLRK